MAIFSNRCEYALRAVLWIAAATREEKKVGNDQISRELAIPAHYTGKIMQELARKGIVSSTKGPGGGFYMTDKQRALPAMRIVDIMDGPNAFIRCGLGLPQCSEQNPCPIHETFTLVRDQLREELEQKTIQQLADGVQKGEHTLL